MAKTLIQFKDNGQDFLRWAVDESGVVIDCWPFQADVWKGLKVTNLAKLKVGGVVEYNHHGRSGCISHLVTGVVPLAPVEVSVRLDGDGYATNTVRGKRASCTYDASLAVERLGDKLFPGYHLIIERLPCTAVGRLYGKWRIEPAGAI